MGSLITTPTVTFNGTSQYASSLQQQISREVSLASQPLQILESQQAATSNKVSAAQSLESALQGLNTAISSLSSASTNNTAATVSDNSVIGATASAGALPGTYTVQVNDPGSYSTAMSADALPTVTDPTSQNISSQTSFTLTVGSNTYQLTPSGSNLNALVAAINASGSTIQATVIDIGTSSQPDYRLALQDTALAPDSIQLSDGVNSNLLSTLSTGTNALYTINGQPASPSPGIATTSSTVTVAPGLSVQLKAAGTSTVQVSLNSNSISNALSSFVNGFNSAQAELQKSYGQNAGPLSGDSTVFASSQALTGLVGYFGSGSGSVQSLADLGVEFTPQGTLTFDPTVIAGFSPSRLSDAINFLGSSTTGFLANATNTMSGLIDPTTGILPNEITALNQQVTDEGNQIQTEQDSINDLQTNLINQMNAADAQIASLEQQSSFLTQLLATTNANNNAGH